MARNYGIGAEAGDIFVQNAELHTHGFVTPDLGMAAYRNSCIIREITGREVYPVERSIAFQQFGVPPGPRPRVPARRVREAEGCRHELHVPAWTRPPTPRSCTPG